MNIIRIITNQPISIIMALKSKFPALKNGILPKNFYLHFILLDS